MGGRCNALLRCLQVTDLMDVVYATEEPLGGWGLRAAGGGPRDQMTEAPWGPTEWGTGGPEGLWEREIVKPRRNREGRDNGGPADRGLKEVREPGAGAR